MKRTKVLAFFVLIIAALIYLIPGCDELVTEVTEKTQTQWVRADFSLIDTFQAYGCAPYTVWFNENCGGNPNWFHWSFGDGNDTTIYIIDSITTDRDTIFNDSIFGDIEHTYSTSGLFSVTLIAKNTENENVDSEEKWHYITVGPLSADFITDISTGCPGLSVTFTPIETEGIAKWEWDFGDGSDTIFRDSTPESISHIYLTADTFQVTLTDSGDCGTTSESNTITIVDCLDPVCSLSVHEGCATLSVEFKDMTYPTAAFRFWSFGNGDTSTLEDPTIEFKTAGTYEIALGVSEFEDGPFAYVYDTVVVYDSVSALFTVVGNSTSCYLPGRQFHVRFLDQSKGNIQNLIWDFGDGDTLYNDTNPIHAYTTPGKYSVSLIAAGLCGEDTIIDTLIDTALVVLSDTLYEETSGFKISPSDTVSDIATEFTFTDTSIGVIEGRKWTLNSHVVNDSTEINYTFPDTGSYEVLLEINNGCNTIEVSRTVVIDTTSAE
ncbi:MAG: hypothetical protein DRP47_04445 [Candidatus Zixiibacteriota bacterium]|nr:MAG: hypothetical protein DRP47_04445 [candidate division Zixibacteria bacterium]